MNPHVEAWRAKQDQLKGQNEGQIAGATLVMINSVCQQVKDDILDAKRTSADIKDTFKSVQNGLNNANDVSVYPIEPIAGCENTTVATLV